MPLVERNDAISVLRNIGFRDAEKLTNGELEKKLANILDFTEKDSVLPDANADIVFRDVVEAIDDKEDIDVIMGDPVPPDVDADLAWSDTTLFRSTD